METVRLKSRMWAGSFEFRRRETNEKGFLTPRVYRFTPDTVTEVPKYVWEELEDEYIDRKENIKYRQALQTL